MTNQTYHNNRLKGSIVGISFERNSDELFFLKFHTFYVYIGKK